MIKLFQKIVTLKTPAMDDSSSPFVSGASTDVMWIGLFLIVIMTVCKMFITLSGRRKHVRLLRNIEKNVKNMLRLWRKELRFRNIKTRH